MLKIVKVFWALIKSISVLQSYPYRQHHCMLSCTQDAVIQYNSGPYVHIDDKGVYLTKPPKMSLSYCILYVIRVSHFVLFVFSALNCV